MKKTIRRAARDTSATGTFRPKQILVPVDFSESTAGLLQFSQALAGQTGARLTLLHVVEPIHVDWKMDTSDLQRERQVQSSRMLRELVEREFGGGKVAAEIRAGPPVETIASFARQTKTDMIIIATHGRTGLKRALLGSVAERVVRHAPCPVLVVR
jgi:universal stress protein A